MSKVFFLVSDVAKARSQYTKVIASLTEAQAHWKPDADTWNAVEITEHLFWAEHGGIAGMWKTLYAIREGTMARTEESVHKNFPVERIIEQTWQPKEKVPAVAAPRMGGTLAFWKSALLSLQATLEDFGKDLKEDELHVQAHPHPISGPMDFQQRLEFLRFHIDRHRQQVEELMKKRTGSSIS